MFVYILELVSLFYKQINKILGLKTYSIFIY